MDVHCHAGSHVDRQHHLRRHRRTNGAAKVYPVRLRIFYFGSRALFHADANRFTGAASVDWSRVLRLGQRFQFVQHRDFLGVHDRPFHCRTRQTTLRFHSGRRNAWRNRRRLHHEESYSRNGAGKPCRHFSNAVCDRLRSCALFSQQLHRRKPNCACSRTTNRRDCLVGYHAHRSLALFIRPGRRHHALYRHVNVGVFSADQSRW